MRSALGIAAMAIFACASPRPAEFPPAVDWLQRYLRIDTSNPPGNETVAAEFLAGILREAGVAASLLETPSGRTSLFAEIGPPETEALVLLHHIDVVPAGEGWSVDPFGGDLDDGILSGRGAVDSKGLGIAHLAAFLNLADQPLPLQRRLILLATADEETGGTEGVGWWIDHRPDLFDDVALVLTEGGYNRAARGAVAWWGIEIDQKRPLWLDLRARSAQVLIEALDRLLARPLDWRLAEPVRSHFQALASGGLPGAFDVEAALASAAPERRLRAGLAVFFLDSLQVNVLSSEGGDARATVDARLLPDTNRASFLESLRSDLGPDVEVSIRLDARPALPSPAEGEPWELFTGTLPGPVVPYFLSGITDARYFRERGVPAYGFSPFALDGSVTRTAHAPDEHLPVAELLRGIERTREILALWALPSPPAEDIR